MPLHPQFPSCMVRHPSTSHTSYSQSYTSRRSLRSSGQRLLEVPCTHLRTCGDNAFQVVAPKQWNELAFFLRSTDSEVAFKRQLKTFLFRLAFG
ncbi:hypothetical protein LDENG_00202950 [Lucifuga dentata]|nr:hypothetical protein LDENG_00202950 [Lucifuga dentata]